MKGPWNGAEWIVNIDPSCEQWSPPFTLGLWSLVTKGQKKNAWSQLIPEQCPGDLPLRSPQTQVLVFSGFCFFMFPLGSPTLTSVSFPFYLQWAKREFWYLYFQGWAPKNLMLSNCGAGQDSRESPWTARSPNQSILKEISPGYSLEGLMLKVKLQYLGYLIQRADSLEKTLMLGKIEGKRRRRW